MTEVVLIITTVTSGLIAGLFFTFSISVMLALHQVDDRTFVDTMQRINRLIQNGVFGLVFMGSLLGSIAMAIIELTGDDAARLTVLLGAALTVLAMLITFSVNIPLNNRLDAAGPVARIKDAGAARKAFEGKWVGANHLRGLIATVGFVLYCVSL